mmetsp:Transcript_1712/g.4806  ORF Transcript_1712/g.4806 Transcript_1712/m.4806 type:complete len:142 (-) Transcript_1712:584-1009(-)
MGAGALWQSLCLALLFSIAIFLHILSCALYDNWYPLIIMFAYLLAPIPLCLFARANSGDMFDSGNKNAQHWAEFTTTSLVTIIVGLPFVLVHVDVVELGAALLDLAGFFLICITSGLAMLFARRDSSDSWGGGVSLFGATS